MEKEGVRVQKMNILKRNNNNDDNDNYNYKMSAVVVIVPLSISFTVAAAMFILIAICFYHCDQEADHRIYEELSKNQPEVTINYKMISDEKNRLHRLHRLSR